MAESEHARTARPSRVRPRLPLLLWLLAAAVTVHRLALFLGQPAAERVTARPAWLDDPDLPLHGEGGFGGTPAAALLLRAATTLTGDGAAWACLVLLTAAALAAIACRALPAPQRAWALPAGIALLVAAIPVRETVTEARLDIAAVPLALAGWLLVSRRPYGALLLGTAAALQPALLLFAPLLLLTGRRNAAILTAGTFAALTAAAWAVLPGDSATFWLHHIAGAGLAPAPDDTANQSLHGALLRLGLSGPGEIVLFTALAATVCALALRRAARYAQEGQPLLAAALTGCAALAATPAAPQQAQLWLALALAGRVGRRTADRPMWPVFVVLALLVPGDALLPKIDSLAVLADNVPLLCALLATCVLRFLPRDSALWARPVRAGLASRPNLLLELALIRVGYWVYSYVRGYVRGDRETVEAHGHQILDLERLLRIDIEHAVNHFVADRPWLADSMDVYYGTFHFAVPLTILGWLLVSHPAAYREARRALAFTTLFGLVGFWLYPLAPPRLMPGLGYIDTANGPQDLDDPRFGALTGVTNPYAAMPSLHVGWSLWCALVLWRTAPYVWLRVLGFVYPVATTVVIVGTANHYLLDAAGGVLVVVLGFAASRAIGRALAARETAAGTPDRDGGGTGGRDRRPVRA